MKCTHSKYVAIICEHRMLGGKKEHFLLNWYIFCALFYVDSDLEV